MTSYAYALAPLLSWGIAGTLKFCINSLRAKHLASDLIGYGGFPSSHSAIVSSITALIALKNGLSHPAFGIALTFALIVVLDAGCLRQHIGKQAKMINQLLAATTLDRSHCLRERIGHTPGQIAAGIIVGICVAIMLRHC